MNDNELFSTSMYEDQTHPAERELASFISGTVWPGAGPGFDGRMAR